MKFKGYKRADGRVGVRNYIAVIPSVFCANKVAEKIAQNIEGVICLKHGVGCSQVGEDLEQTARTLINLANHPNVGGVLIVGLGCERFTPFEFYNEVKKSGKPVEKIIIQEEGDTLQTIDKGTVLLKKLYHKVSNNQRKEFDISELVLGLECGGTDAFSGIAANPSIGVTSDTLISLGGSSIFSETTELLGAEKILMERCVNKKVAELLLKTIKKTERELAISTSDPTYKKRSNLISTGNFSGGISTVVEKALGNIEKAGKSPINGVLKFAETIPNKGLFLMDTPGQDGESTTGLVAGGAQIILFTTGRGTPTGFPIAPVIKVTGNPQTYQKMKINIDFDTSKIITSEKTITEMGKEIFNLVLKVASGEKTKAEILGHDELFIIPRILHY
jgi:altronate dehydratase large subunit